jgi:hypothetical protein
MGKGVDYFTLKSEVGRGMGKERSTNCISWYSSKLIEKIGHMNK